MKEIEPQEDPVDLLTQRIKANSAKIADITHAVDKALSAKEIPVMTPDITVISELEEPCECDATQWKHDYTDGKTSCHCCLHDHPDTWIGGVAKKDLDIIATVIPNKKIIVTHIPTGLTVMRLDSKFNFRNRCNAMKDLAKMIVEAEKGDGDAKVQTPPQA